MNGRYRIAFLTLATPLVAGSGCVWYGPHSMTRVWADKNTLNRPAFFVERLAHAPPPREQVERIRWQYGVGPGQPVVAPQPLMISAAATADGPTPAATDSDRPAPAPPAAEPPASGAPTPENPVPAPPEPISGASRSSRSRQNMAWLFVPSQGVQRR